MSLLEWAAPAGVALLSALLTFLIARANRKEPPAISVDENGMLYRESESPRRVRVKAEKGPKVPGHRARDIIFGKTVQK